MRRPEGGAMGVLGTVGKGLLAKGCWQGVVGKGLLARGCWQRSGNGNDDEYRSDGWAGASRRSERFAARLSARSSARLSGNDKRDLRFTLSLRFSDLPALLLA